jgi:hypothetical protein
VEESFRRKQVTVTFSLPMPRDHKEGIRGAYGATFNFDSRCKDLEYLREALRRIYCEKLFCKEIDYPYFSLKPTEVGIRILFQGKYLKLPFLLEFIAIFSKKYVKLKY